MNESTSTFCAMVRQRSKENKHAMELIAACHDIPLSPAVSILRQELDSMVRVIFLLSKDIVERNRYIDDILRGVRWKTQTVSGKERYVLDKDMIELSQTLHGWTKSVYKFGCAFIHLSEFHNHLSSEPFARLSNAELQDIASHLSWYHGYDPTEPVTLESVKFYLPMIFEKINTNLVGYIDDLEAERKLNDDSWISQLQPEPE